MVSKSIIAISCLFALITQGTAIQKHFDFDFDIGYCLCRFDKSGYCKAIIPARRNKACKCHAKEWWYDRPNYEKCKGEEVDCANPGSPHCINPDNSYLTCLQGKGECKGYTPSN